jgi:hypothetical protein
MTFNEKTRQWEPVKKRKRIFMWFFLAVQALFIIWIIAGASSSGSATAKSCANLTGQALQTCQDASHAGTGIGVALIVIVWCIVDFLLAITWLIVRMSRRR